MKIIYFLNMTFTSVVYCETQIRLQHTVQNCEKTNWRSPDVGRSTATIVGRAWGRAAFYVEADRRARLPKALEMGTEFSFAMFYSE